MTTSDQKNPQEFFDLESLQASIKLPFVIVDKDLYIQHCVNTVANLLSIDAIPANTLITDLDWQTPIEPLTKYILSAIKTGHHYRDHILIGKQNYQLSVTPYKNKNQHIIGAVIVFTDITNLIATKKALKEERELAHVTLESISDGVIRLNNSMDIDYMNPAAEALCGYDESEVISRNITDIIHLSDEVSHKTVSDAFVANTGHVNVSLLTNRKNQQLSIEHSCTLLTDGDGEAIGFLFVMRDVSESREALKRVLWQSTHDHLTGLVNRQEMESRLSKSLLTATSNNILSTFMFIDLDQFKIINDTCGHLAGDELLRRISRQISRLLRSRDTLARLGGDEFGVLLERCSMENAYGVAIKIRDAISSYRFIWDEKLFKVGCCIGLIAVNKDVQDVTQLLRDADSACYAAKSHGGNSIQIHLDSDEELVQQKQQMSIITDIHEALENKRLRLYYQPIISMQTGLISHWEVLVRMINRRYEFLLPQEFLPASERFGFIRQIDHWVIENTAEHLLELHQLINERPKLAINLSASTLADPFCKEMLVSLFQQNSNLHEQLIFEITETSALSNIHSVNLLIHQLREFGCVLALDDFGTGVSTYSYLKSLDIDMIKIDGEFIQDVTENAVNQSIVKSIVHIAGLMGISTTAEWVDSQETYHYLKAIGVDYMQGNYLGEPVSAEEFVNAVLNGVSCHYDQTDALEAITD